MTVYNSQYPPVQSGTYVKATTTYTATYCPYFATDPAKPLIGSWNNNSWVASAYTIINQRFHIDLGSAKIVRRIYYENLHDSGARITAGVQNFTFWGSNTAASFANLIYGNDGGWTQLTVAQNTFDQHVAADQADPKYIVVTNSIAYRYYAFKFADVRGHDTYMGVRRIELQAVPSTVTTQAVTDIASDSATGNGNITDTGGENVTKRGVCWNTTGSPTIADNKSEETGSFGTGAFTRPITGLSHSQLYYVRAYAYNSGGYSYGSQVSFTTLNIAPTVTTQAPTDIGQTTVTGNGNIIALGGENATVRGFKYSLIQEDTWDVHDDGSFGTGAFTKGITGLTANIEYWIRAYATNSIGTSYGDWVKIQTAASGVIPTGTKIDICSDYLGYTYKLQRSETDDGFPYTAYLVISTDLTDKQGLAFYKRILDLHLYFRSEDSGTAKIEVKRDSEAEWQPVGSISLTGTEDIIVKHLAVDIRAKHFLFKISAANKFRFLGCLYEYIPEGMR